MSAKPLKYSEKIVVMLTPEQSKTLRSIADDTGDTASGILRRLAIQFIKEHENEK